MSNAFPGVLSRRHAQIEWDRERNAWHLKDLGSVNGVSVNGIKRLLWTLRFELVSLSW